MCRIRKILYLFFILLFCTPGLRAQIITSGGGPSAFTIVNYPGNFTGYYDGFSVIFRSAQTCNASPGMDIAGKGTKTIVNATGGALVTGDIQAGQVVTLVFDAGNNNFRMISPSGNGWGSLSQWITTGSDIYYNTGRVGIGTNAPSTMLHLYGANPFLQLENNASASSGIYFKDVTNGDAYLAQSRSNNGIVVGSVPGDLGLRVDMKNIIFSTNNGNNAHMYIQAGGNVGIGSVNPQHALQIERNSNTLYDPATTTSRQLSIRNLAQPAVAGSFVGIEFMASTNAPSSGYGYINYVTTNPYTGDFTFVLRPDGVSPNEERMRITGAGNVGIGTNSPNQKLTLDGNFGILETGSSPMFHSIFQGGDQTDNISYTLPGMQGAANTFLQNNGAGDLSWVAGGAGITGSGNINFIPKFTAPTSLGNSLFYDNGSSTGIGTSSPSERFEVVNNSSQAMMAVDGTGNPGYKFRLSGTEKFAVYYNNAQNGLYFYSNTLLDAPFVVMDNGRVGIGTISPGALLDLGLAGTKLGVLRFAGNTSGNVTLQPASSAGTWTMTLPTNAGAGGQFLQTDGAGVTSWQAAPLPAGAVNQTLRHDGTNWTATSFLHNTASEIGIGTTTPQNKLDVEGAVAIGATYSGTNIAPANGMIVEGNVGIGTSTPNSLLQVRYLIDFTGVGNTLLGYQAGNPTANTGNSNTAVGHQALFSGTTAFYNTSIGYQALYTNNGSQNTASGYKALFANSSGNYNTASGYQALTANTIGNDNTAVGQLALSSNLNGGSNTAVGRLALSGNVAGSGNVAVGYNAGASNTGSNNAAIGYFSDVAAGLTNATAIGYNAFVSSSNSLVLGSGANVGIGTTSPTNLLHVSNTSTNTATYFENTNAANAASVLMFTTNGSGNAMYGYSTGTGRAAKFEIVNATSAADAVWGLNNGDGKGGKFEISNATGIGDALWALTNGSGRAAYIQQTNGALAIATPVVLINRANATANGKLIDFAITGVSQGTITNNGGVISYNAFTGSHYAHAAEKIETNMLVSLTGINQYLNKDTTHEIIYGVTLCKKENDPGVMGTFSGASDSLIDLVTAVGNGTMWVVNDGENLNPGDYLISSSVPGYAMKDNGKYEVSYIVARAAEPVDWNGVAKIVSGKKCRLISVFYENFTRNNKAEKLEAELNKLKFDNEILKADVQKIKNQLGIGAETKK